MTVRRKAHKSSEVGRHTSEAPISGGPHSTTSELSPPPLLSIYHGQEKALAQTWVSPAATLTLAVQRGFATTSVARKSEPAKEEPVPEPESPTKTQPIQPVPSADADWEDEKSIEEIELQSLVDRLHDKGEREVARIIKVGAPKRPD